MGGAVFTTKEALAQVAAMDKAVATETARLTALLAGQSKATADIAAKYQLLLPADQAHLTALKQQSAALIEAQAAAARKTAADAQMAAMEKELAAETARLTVLLAGESKAAADVAAKYTLVSAADQARLVAVKLETAALLEARAAEEQKAAADAKAAEKAALLAEKTDKAKVSLQQFGTAASQAGRAMTLGISAPLLAAGGFALNASQEIQKGMNTIRAETGATGEKLASLGQSFKDVAGQVPQDMDTVGKAVALVAQRTNLTGIALTNLSTQFLTLARVTGGQVTPLVTQSTKVFQQWGVSVQQQGEALNQFLRAHEATGIGVEDLTSKLLKFGPALKTAGLSLADSEALLGALNKQGVNTDKVMTALNMTFTKWAKAGVTDAHAALINLIAAVQKAPTAFAALKVATDAGMGGRGGVDFVNAVRTGGVEFEKFLSIINSGKDTVKKAGDDTLTVANQFAILEKKIALASEPLGKFIAGKLKDLGTALDGATPKLAAFGKGFEHQSGTMKDTELAITGLAISLGPLIYALGRAAQAWAGFTTVLKVGAPLLIPAAALTALTAFIAAYLFNFHGLRDQLIAGFHDIWENATSGARDFFSGIQEIGKSSLSQVADDFQTGISKLVDYWHAGIARIRGEQAAAAPSAELGNPALTTAEQRALSAFKPPVLPPTFGPGRGSLSGGNAGASPRLKDETDAHRQLREALLAESKAKEVLSLMTQGYNLHQAELIARYGPATAAIMKQTEAYDAAARKIEDVNKANQKATHLAAELHAQMLAMQAELQGKAPTHVPQVGVRVEGADVAHQGAVTQAQREFDQMAARLKAFKAEQAKAGNDITSLGKQIDAALARDAVALNVQAGATVKEASAQELYNKALKTGIQFLIDNAAEHLANASQIAAEAESQKALTAAFKETEKVMSAIAAVEAHQQQVADQLGGAGKQLTEVQKALNLAYADGDPFLVAWAEDLARVGAAQDAALKVQKLGTEIMNGYTRELERQTQLQEAATGITHETAVAQQKLKEAIASGNDDAILAAAVWVKMAQANDTMAKATRDNAKEQTAFEKGLNKARQTLRGLFEHGLQDVMKNGFKGFFSTILGDLDSLLIQMAEKIAAARLTEAILGKDTAGTGGGSGGGGLVGLLGGLIGGLFGGGGGATAGMDFSGAGDVAAGAAAMPFGPGLASGGRIAAFQPRMVGEMGPEMFIPRAPGSIVPNQQLAAAGASGGHTTNIHFNITTPDVAGFKQSQGQMMETAHRQAEMWRARNGG